MWLQGPGFFRQVVAVASGLAESFAEWCVLLLRGDGDPSSTSISDSSLVARAVTVSGNTNVEVGQTRFGTGSIEFDGTGDYLEYADSTDWQFGTGDFTIEGWVRFANVTADQAVLAYGNGAGTLGSDVGFVIDLDATADKIRGYFFNSTTAYICTGTTTVVANTWYHFAYTRASGTARLFVNGNLEVANSHALAPNTPASATMKVGGPYLSTATRYLNGWVDGLRILKGVAAYTAAFTPLTKRHSEPVDTHWAKVAFLARMEGADNGVVFTDEEPLNPKAITVGGNAKTKTDQFKFGSSSAYFDGTTDYLTWSRTGYDFLCNTLESFTVECWIRPTTSFANYRGIFQIGSNNTNLNSFTLLLNITTGQPYCAISGNGGNFQANPNLSAPLDTWTHVAATFNHLTGVLNIWVGGALSNTATKGTGSFGAPGFDPTIGSYSSNTSYALGFLGWIDQFRITRGVVRYTAAFTPPVVAFPVYGPAEPDPYYHLTKLLLNCNGVDGSVKFVDTSPAGNPVSVLGNAQVDTAQSRFGGASLLMDGTGDYLSLPVTADFLVGAGDFTIECWIRPVNAATNQHIFWYGNDGNYFNGVSLEISNGLSGSVHALLYDGSAGDSAVSSAGVVSSGVWQHVAMSRSGGQLRAFVNGALVASVASTRTQGTPGTGPTVQIGARYGATNRTAYFNGHIDDFRFTKGVGRYTTAFTPPTREFGTVQGDPHEDSVVLLIKGESDELSSIIKDYSKDNRAITVTSAFVSRYERRFGSGSIDFRGAGSDTSVTQPALTVPSTQASLGIGDFTVEMWVNPRTAPAVYGVLFDCRPASTQGIYPTLYLKPDATLGYFVNSVERITGGYAALSTWSHVAVSRVSGTTRMFVNGVQAGSNYTDTNSYSVATSMTIGRDAFDTTNYGFDGFMDQIRITKGVGRYSAAFQPLTRPFPDYSRSEIPDYKLWTKKDAFPEHTVLLLRGNGAEASTTITDESPVARTMTANGNTNIDTSRFMFGTGSIEFDGTGDYVTAPDSTDWDFTTGLTIELWLYVTAFDTNGCMLVSQENAAAAGGFEFAVSATGVLKFNRNDTTTVVQSAAGAITTGVWTHVAVSWDGITYRLYKNGRIQASAINETGPANVAGLLRIGNYVTNGDSDLNGYIEDLRILKDVAAHVVDFTPPARTLPSTDDPYYGLVSLLLRGEGSDGSTTFTDDSPLQRTVSVFGNAQIDTAQFKMGASSMLFDGTGDYLTVPNSSDFASSSFTVEFWVRQNSLTGQQCWITNYQGVSNGWYVQLAAGDNVIVGFSGDGSDITGSTPLLVNTWYHIAVSGSPGSYKLFVNGVQDGATYTGATTLTSTAALQIGALSGGTFFDGWLDNIRYTREVRYTQNFVPPALSFPVQGPPEPDPYYHLTKLLLWGDGADASTTFTDQSAAARGNATVVGDAQVDTAQSRFGGSSILFDGTGSGLSYANSADFQFGSGDFTIEFWFRVNGWSSSYNTLVNLWASTGGRSYIILVTSGALDFLWSANGTGTDKPSPVRGPSAPTTGVWYHAAFTRQNGTFRTFLNGVSGTPVFDSAAMYAATPSLTLGYTTDAGDTHRHNGWMDDLRITKGVARYTANFIPPTRELGTVQGDAFPEDVVLLLKGEGPDASTAIKDYSKYNRAVTVNGNAQIDTAQFKWGLASILFDGAGDYVDVPDSPLFTLGTLDFTIEMWVRFNTAPASRFLLSGQGDSSGLNTSLSYLIEKTAANKLAGSFFNSSTQVLVTGTTTVTTATWYHVALVRFGTNLYLFVNGSLEASTTSALAVNDSSSRLAVGRGGEYNGLYHDGWIDDFRMTVGRARYTAAFPALTREFPAY